MKKTTVAVTLLLAGLVCAPAARAQQQVTFKIATLAPEKGIKVPIVFADAHLLVVNKPAGLTVHPGSGRPGGTLVNALLGMGVPLAAAGGDLRPGVVHRIDKDTSGLLVLAKTDKAFWALAQMARDHEFEREYLAIVAQWLRFFGVGEAEITAARQESLVWALERGSRSGRVAYQFARDFAGQHG